MSTEGSRSNDREDRFLSLQARYGSEIISVMNADNELLYESASVEEMLGYRDAGEVPVTEDRFRHVHPEDAEGFARAFEGCFATPGESPPVEYRYKDASGAWRWLESRGVNLLDDPEVEAVVVSTREITSRKSAEEDKRESERRLRSAFEDAPIGVALVGVDNRFLQSNPALCEMLGYSSQELSVRTSFELTHSEDHEASRRYMEAVRRGPDGEAERDGEGSAGLEKRYIRKDGTVVWVLLNTSVVADERGEPAYYVCQYQDITVRKEAEERLRLLESVVVNANDAILITEAWPFDEPGPEIVYVNEAFTHMTGYTPEEILGKTPRILQGPETERVALDEIRRSLPRWEPVRVEVLNYRKDGTQFWVELNIVPVADETDRITHWVSVQRETTERRRVEDLLRLRERAISESTDAILITDPNQPDNPIVYVNPAFERDTGYSAAEAVGRNPRFLQNGDRDQSAVEELRAAVEQEREIRVELLNHRKNGEPFHNEVNIYPVRDAEGQLLNYVGVQNDVTERRRSRKALAESEERWRNAFENAPIGMALVSLPSSDPSSDRRYLRVNRAMCEMLGYSEEELLSKTSTDVTHPEDRGVGRPNAERVMEEGNALELEKRYIHADGHVVRVIRSVSLVRDAEGNPSHFVTQFRDVTERRQAEEALRASEERHRAVVEDQTELLCRFRPGGVLTFVNDAYCRYFGVGREEMIGRNFLALIPREDREGLNEHLSMLSPERPVDTMEHRAIRHDGEVRWLQWTDRALFDDEGRVVEYQCVGRDVTGRRALEKELERQAMHDDLTDLPNRRLLTDRLSHALARSERDGGGVAVLFLDLDDFKAVNDTLGHDAGDELLVAVAGRLMEVLRPEDTVSRLSGDEFVVLLENTDLERASAVAERISRTLKAPFTLGAPADPRGASTTASIGIALTDSARRPHARTGERVPEDLLKEADAALYRAKEKGKASVEVFEPRMGEQARERLSLRGELRRALERDEFTLLYQPIADLSTGEIVGLEALVRWEHPERGLLAPEEFIPAAEESGLIVELGGWVLREACLQAKRWSEYHRGKKLPPWLSINLSARQLSHPLLVEEVTSALKSLEQAGPKAPTLMLEITESTTIGTRGMGPARTAIEGLKDLGVRLAVDDFGTGYSSISYLTRFPVDTVKIDRSIVADLGRDPRSEAVVSAILALARSLGEKVVAEGVEDPGQLRLLRELGCEFGQGHYFWPPCPPEEALELYLEALRGESGWLKGL